MIEDEVILEIRAAREAFALLHGNDPWAMVEALRKEDEAGDWPVVRLAPRRRAIPETPTRDVEMPSPVGEMGEILAPSD